MVHEEKSEDKKKTLDIHQLIKKDPALFTTPTEGEPKNITVALQLVLKRVYKTSVLVSSEAAGLIVVNYHPNIAEHHA